MANIKVSNHYQYITKAQESVMESDVLEVLSDIESNLLEFQLDFSSGKWYRNELKIISNELIDMAQYFIEQQELFETGDLWRGVHAEPVRDGIKFYNEMPYAGHLEYGHRGRDGKFVPAYPFMRPALYTVSRASQGSFANVLGELASGVFRQNGKGYKGISNLKFEHSFSKNISNLNHLQNPQAGRNHQYTRKGLAQKSKIDSNRFMASILADSQFRNPFSVRRTGNRDRDRKHRKDLSFEKDGQNSNIKNYFARKIAERGKNR